MTSMANRFEVVLLKFIHPLCTCYLISAIQHKYVDWKDYLLKRLTGARTLPSNFYTKVVYLDNNNRSYK